MDFSFCLPQKQGKIISPDIPKNQDSSIQVAKEHLPPKTLGVVNTYLALRIWEKVKYIVLKLKIEVEIYAYICLLSKFIDQW